MKNGFTLIELMIVLCIIGIVVAIVSPSIQGRSGGNYSPQYQMGVNGLSETRCIGGMQFVVGSSGSVQQILGPNGGGIPCN